MWHNYESRLDGVIDLFNAMKQPKFEETVGL